MVKKTTVVKLRKQPRKQAKEKAPRKPLHPKGYLMGDVASALLQQFQYDNVLTYEMWENLLAENGRPRPEHIDGHKDYVGWLHQERYQLNAFGRNRDLLLTLGNDDVLAMGFCLTAVNGKEGHGFQLLTVWGDVTKVDRPKQVVDKTIKAAKDHRNALPFCPDDKITQDYFRKIFRQEADALKHYHEEAELRVKMIAADAERTISVNKRKQLKKG